MQGREAVPLEKDIVAMFLDFASGIFRLRSARERFRSTALAPCYNPGCLKWRFVMFNSSVIDVAIGLVFVFLLLSLIASSAKEGLESFFKRRAKDLEEGIKELIGSDGDQFIGSLYDHGLINSLFRGSYATAKKTGDLPSYIPSKNFALALMDLRNKSALKDGVTPWVPLPLHVQQAFDAFELTAGKDLDKIQKQVEDWYNSSMDRVSGWYKRRTQAWIFLIGLVFTIAVNADSIVIAKRLSTDTTLRQAVVRAAERETKNGPPPVPDSTAPGIKQSLEDIRNHLSDLDGVGLPIGWQNEKDTSAIGILTHTPGWLITALAISLGAPFWFDMLNKIMVVRSTVKPSEKSKEEGSKDPSTPKVAASTTQ